MTESGIITGQYVRIQPTVASVGDRIFAQIIDWVVMAAYTTLITLIVSAADITAIIWIVILYVFPLLFYTVLCEILNQGQTLGKMVMNMRVIKQDGTQPTTWRPGCRYRSHQATEIQKDTNQFRRIRLSGKELYAALSTGYRSVVGAD